MGARIQKARKARLPVDLWCDIRGGSERAVGHLRNLNLGGCRIVGPSAFPVRGTVDLLLASADGEPDLTLRAQVRWLELNAGDGLFDLGCQFVHEGDSADRVERLLKRMMKRSVAPPPGWAPPFARFMGVLLPAAAPASAAGADLRTAFAAEWLDRLTQPGR